MSNDKMGGQLLAAIMRGDDLQIDSALELMSAAEIRDALKPHLSAKSDMEAWHDYAAAALQGALAADYKDTLRADDAAICAAEYADAMLAERAKRQEGQ